MTAPEAGHNEATMELTEFTAGTQAAARESYLWEVPGKPVSIRLDFDVIDRLGAEVMRAFSAVPRRGLEVGGILLGTVETGAKMVARVEDFEPVASKHTEGPSYVVSSGEDRNRFRQAVERWKSVSGGRLRPIGFYRSHTREHLGLTQEDIDLFWTCFPEGSGIILLVKPYATRPPAAGLFFCEEGGTIRRESSYREFPFRRQDLGGGTTPESAPGHPSLTGDGEANEPASVAQGEIFGLNAASSTANESSDDGKNGSAAPPVTTRSLRLRGGWVWVPLSFIFLLLGTVLGFQVALSVRSQIHNEPSHDPYAMNLTATPSANSVHVRWDRRSPVIREAERGVLTIIENGEQKTVDLDAGHLRNGSVIYRRASSDVKFRLEVFTKDKTSVAESVEFRTTTAK